MRRRGPRPWPGTSGRTSTEEGRETERIWAEGGGERVNFSPFQSRHRW